MISRIVLCLVVISTYVVAQDEISEDLIDEIFNTNSKGGIPGVESCDCVPYYLCNNSTVNTNGEGIIDIRTNEGPCEDYLETCCKKGDTRESKISPEVPLNKKEGCGYRNQNGVGFRITGDKDNEAQFGEFPWMVAILREEAIAGHPKKLNVYQCGGALIHPQAVVTAAHCVIGKGKQFKIRAGEWDTQTTNEVYPFQDADVDSIKIHPDYYSGGLFNDIAILFLKTPVKLEPNVDLICLPPQGTIVENSRCFSSGWGKDVFGKQGKYQVILKKIELPIVKGNDCQEKLRKTRLGKHFVLDPSFICAGGESGQDTCRGDGGGPLVCRIPGQNRYYQAGIVAWGVGCGDADIPGVYVNVPLFRNWIDDQMKTNKLDISVYQY